MNILHISDVHFRKDDETHSQLRITDSLIKAIDSYDKKIDYCIFTGDLANRALSEEYETAEEWLKDVFEAMNNDSAKMVICPGNHDVERDKANVFNLRSAGKEKYLFNLYKKQHPEAQEHLKRFSNWHSKFKELNPWVISSWEEDVNYISLKHENVNVNFIMANSAMLSCGNDDQNNLCVNVNQLNDCLRSSSKTPGLNLFMMHHPLGENWFSDWNEIEVDKLLKQQSGCHFFFSGHMHDLHGTSVSSNTGQALTSFQCGAAHTSGKWKNEFFIIEIDIHSSKVYPNSYKYSENSGEWTKDNEQSRSMVVDLTSLEKTSEKKKS